MGGGSGRLEERINNSTRRIGRERGRLQYVVVESAEKVAGLKRKVDELTGEVVSARVGVECWEEEMLGLESQVEAVTDLLGPLSAENVNLKTNLNKAYVRECRTRQKKEEDDDDDNAYNTLSSKEEYITKCVEATMNKMLPRTGAKKKAKFLTKMISDGKIFGSDGKEGYNEVFLGQARKKFEPWRVLQALDQDSRCGNFSTVEIMRDVEGLEKYERGVFHSKSAMSRVAKELEVFAHDYVPFQSYVSDTGHMNIAFDYEAVLRNCLLAMGLLGKAECGSVSVCFTLDFAEVCSTTKRGHVLAGMKIIDKDATHPRTKKLLFNYEPTTDSSNGGGVHANELLTCIPLHFVVGKESNQVFSTDLKPFFDFSRQISKDGLKARNDLEKDLFPFDDVTYPMDMSAEQKCFDLGGGCKVKEFFCVKCACRSSGAMFFWEGGATYNCMHAFCKGDGRCHHFEVDDQEEIDRKRVMLTIMLEGGGEGDVDADFSDTLHAEEKVSTTTEMTCDPAVINKATDPHHIDFVISSADQLLKTTFIARVNKEFGIRGWMNTHADGSFMTIKQKVSKLRASLNDGRMVKVLRDSIKRIEDKEDGFLFGLHKAVHCVLHLENRVNEKLVVMTLLEGLKHRTNGVQSQEYFQDVADIFNNGMLSEQNGNWRVPQDSGELKVLSFSNVTARRLVSNIDQIFDLVFKFHNDDGVRKQLFHECLKVMFPTIVTALRKRSSFSDDEITQLQKDIDNWYHAWMYLTGLEGMTNYIHLLGSGHISYYLKKYRNLYRYSNQSWERLNKRVKRFYLQRTQRGGHGKHAGKDAANVLICKHTKPLARWLQRVIMWNTGLGAEFFIKKYGTV